MFSTETNVSYLSSYLWQEAYTYVKDFMAYEKSGKGVPFLEWHVMIRQ